MPPTSGMRDEDRDRLYADFARLQTLILDAIERLAVLETSSRFADMQRQAVLDATTQLGLRLEAFSRSVTALESVPGRVNELAAKVNSYDGIVAEIRGGSKALGFVRQLVGFLFGVGIGLLGVWLKWKT